jgi:hypothetical protein
MAESIGGHFTHMLMLRQVSAEWLAENRERYFPKERMAQSYAMPDAARDLDFKPKEWHTRWAGDTTSDQELLEELKQRGKK